MMAIVIGIHVVVCFLLICMILIQSGRGGGLVESFSGVESVFGTKTSSFMTKLTSILSVIFFLSCLTLALLSVRQSKSLMSGVKPAATEAAAEKTAAAPAGETEMPEKTVPSEGVPSSPDTAAAVQETTDNGASAADNRQKTAP